MSFSLYFPFCYFHRIYCFSFLSYLFCFLPSDLSPCLVVVLSCILFFHVVFCSFFFLFVPLYKFLLLIVSVLFLCRSLPFSLLFLLLCSHFTCSYCVLPFLSLLFYCSCCFTYASYSLSYFNSSLRFSGLLCSLFPNVAVLIACSSFYCRLPSSLIRSFLPFLILCLYIYSVNLNSVLKYLPQFLPSFFLLYSLPSLPFFFAFHFFFYSFLHIQTFPSYSTPNFYLLLFLLPRFLSVSSFSSSFVL